jgi:hypothetical protein
MPANRPNILFIVAALGIHDRDMHTFLRQRVADALPEPAIAACNQRDRATYFR